MVPYWKDQEQPVSVCSGATVTEDVKAGLFTITSVLGRARAVTDSVLSGAVHRLFQQTLGKREFSM